MPTEKKKVPGSVLDIIKSGISGKIREPNLAELAQHFFDLAGGERNVAKMLFDQYRDPACPNSVRTKIIQFMLQHLKWLNERTGTLDELGNLTVEDLQRELDTHIRSVAQVAHDKARKREQEAAHGEPERRSQQSA
jgi:hypothetical protein